MEELADAMAAPGADRGRAAGAGAGHVAGARAALTDRPLDRAGGSLPSYSCAFSELLFDGSVST